MEQIQKDFDRIAALSEREADAGGVYDGFLAHAVPAPCRRALEVGCGTGTFTRRLARLAKRVTAIDLSNEMVRVARERSVGHANVDYQAGDVLGMNLAADHFDCVTMIATLHHLPAEPVIEKLKQSLAPGGVLIIHDLLTPSGFLDRLTDLVRLPTNVAFRWFRTGRLWPKREVRRAWAEHGRNERYFTRRDVTAMRDGCMPGGEVTYHLLWRYTIVWRKPETAGAS